MFYNKGPWIEVNLTKMYLNKLENFPSDFVRLGFCVGAMKAERAHPNHKFEKYFFMCFDATTRSTTTFSITTLT